MLALLRGPADDVRDIVRSGVRTGEFRDVDPVTAARMLVALTVMNGIWSDRQTGVPLLCHKKEEDVFQELAHFYLHSLTARGGASAQADGAPLDDVQFIPLQHD